MSGVASVGLDSGKEDVDSVLLSSFSHNSSRASTATLRPARDFLISRMSRSADDGAAAAEDREVVRGGGDGGLLRTVDGGVGSSGSGIDGGGPGGTIARAHGLVETVAAGFGGGCGADTLVAGCT